MVIKNIKNSTERWGWKWERVGFFPVDLQSCCENSYSPWIHKSYSVVPLVPKAIYEGDFMSHMNSIKHGKKHSVLKF